MSPTLFKVYLEEIIKKGTSEANGVKVGGKRVQCIRFTDDKAILVESERMMKEMLGKQNKSCEEYGMKINSNKTKGMVISKQPKIMKVNINGSKIEQVKSFRYLGSLVEEDMKYSKEVKAQ